MGPGFALKFKLYHVQHQLQVNKTFLRNHYYLATQFVCTKPSNFAQAFFLLLIYVAQSVLKYCETLQALCLHLYVKQMDHQRNSYIQVSSLNILDSTLANNVAW